MMVPAHTIKTELLKIIDSMFPTECPVKYMQTEHIVARWLDGQTISIEISTSVPLRVPNA